MNAALFQRLALQCEELLPHARSELVKEQLRLWAAEFRERAAEAEMPQEDRATVAPLD